MDGETVFLPSTSVLELVLRGTVLYLAVFVLMRVAGRHESGELNMADLILVLVISEATSIGIGGEAHSIADSIVVVVTILLWSIALDGASYRWHWASRLVKPAVRPLIVDGVLDLRTARRELLTRSEIDSALRQQGIDDIARVYRAFVEPDGTISVIERPDG